MSYKEKAIERFFRRVSKTSSCWNWTGHVMPNGYGQFGYRDKVILVHRFSYELFKKRIPKRLVVDHLCRNRKCVNPKHLRITTNKINILIGIGLTAKNKRKTHCLNGHPLTPNNLVKSKSVRKLKTRRCIICIRNRDKLRRKKKI